MVVATHWTVAFGKAAPSYNPDLLYDTMLEPNTYSATIVELIPQARKPGSEWWDNIDPRAVSHAKSLGWEIRELLREIPGGSTVHFTHTETPVVEKVEPLSTYQSRVQIWLVECFGLKVASSVDQRAHRFFEEATELVQSVGMSREFMHQLVDHVMDKPVGEPMQEAGGTLVTLAGLCCAAGLNLHDAGEAELARLNDPYVMAQKRIKHQNKPVDSPLPE